MDLPESQNAISGRNRDYFALVADKKTAASPVAKLAGGGERRASAVSSVRFPRELNSERGGRPRVQVANRTEKSVKVRTGSYFSS